MIVSAVGSESTSNLGKKKRSNEHRGDEYEQIEKGGEGVKKIILALIVVLALFSDINPIVRGQNHDPDDDDHSGCACYWDDDEHHHHPDEPPPPPPAP